MGRGVHLRPYQPYALGQLLFKREQSRVISSKETKESYSLPVGYEVNDSPPFPMNESLNQVIIEESWDRFEKQMSMDANVTVSNTPFSVSASSSWNNRLRAEQEAYYAVRSSFVPLWMIYVPDPTHCIDEIREPDIPVPFSHKHRRAYDEFFRRYGSHYVRGAWVGGKSMLVFTVLKSSSLNKEDIQAGIKASFGGQGGGANAKSEQSKEKLRNSSQCTVVGKGGDEMLLAAMSSLDQQAYDQWLKTIAQNPQVIELDVVGIWTLVRDPRKATALMEAYKESVSFDPITAVFDIDREIYFIRGSKFVRYDRERKVTLVPQPITDLMPLLENDGFERIDAAFRGKDLVSPSGEKLDRKLFVFRQNRFIRFDLDKRQKDDGYPKLISEGWPGMPFERIDAVLVTGFDTVYFFLGNQYVRFNPLKNRVDDGYPQPISKRWVGVTFDRIDAAIYWGSGKAYFFKGDQHIRYDLANYRTDPGFPKYIIGNYVEDWKFIDD
ncbi:hemopexin repeat-containing protein [Archangium sp.]|uniref:hemopexin repeat-containing protein n=1 Tax=Archangium sp. TaxID=1872627 RepID=UPI002D3610B3|nr:hemopexin repeat-containing protein [Archangium sp.]HYO54262.1 hemopexin repeat-containing protein [Archangium sp.]